MRRPADFTRERESFRVDAPTIVSSRFDRRGEWDPSEGVFPPSGRGGDAGIGLTTALFTREREGNFERTRWKPRFDLERNRLSKRNPHEADIWGSRLSR